MLDVKGCRALWDNMVVKRGKRGERVELGGDLQKGKGLRAQGD